MDVIRADACTRLPADTGGAWAGGTGPDGVDLVRMLDAMPAGFCLLDPEWRFRYVNGEAERLMRHRSEEVVGRTVADMYPETVGSVFEAAFRTAMCSGEPVSFEAPYPGPTAEGWLEVRAWPEPGGLAVYFLDVTDRVRAEEAARRATGRAALLASVTAELSGALDGESALGRLAQLVVPTLADGCIVTVVDREGRARDVGSWHADPRRRAMLERYTEIRLDTLPMTSPVALALHAGTAVTESVTSVLDLMPPGPARGLLQALGPESAVVLPLPAEERTVGVLTLYQDPGRDLGDDDLETLGQVAVQAGRAIERVHRQSQQAQLAEALQRSLLTDPPEIDDAAVVVRYVPAAEAARVGGDWYDAFLQRDGAAVVVIGDVVGHDTAAAAAMGQLRGLLRGIAHYSGAGPAEVLRGLDEAIWDMHTDTLATAAVARLERADGNGWTRLRWANAGHPPPLLLSPDGDVTVLGEPVGDLMLGVDPAAERVETVVPLQPGTVVLLYSDGLVERRGSTIDAGSDRLVEHLRELAGRPLDDLCDALLRRMLLGTPEDDVALLAVRIDPRGAASS
ncbi:SpoIIE family protein phosphatase [Blastococcus sp. CT_GayMR19]|uniref:SpoIIE family protein phosphatase n=1 Tax=Blastococcus sp. CT_GayMR19 TaxID=2559608 RepID=UPI001FD7EE6E|nr:SpoIIE family protein phosphatase [Blastococcus sp. CT_GayMR19]